MWRRLPKTGKAAQEITLPAIEQLEKLDCDSTSDYANLLIYEGCYQSRFGLREVKADEYLAQGYRLHLDQQNDDLTMLAFRFTTS